MSIDGDYNADRLFDQNVTEENMIKSLSTLRKVGVKIPKRKRKSRKQTEGGE